MRGTLPLVAVMVAAGAQAVHPRLDAAIRRIQPQVPGMSIAIAIGGRIAYAKGVGTTSLATPTPPTADTQYRVASVSKPITAVAIFKLVEERSVDLDRAARDYCPALAPLNGAPTVRHFLLHQSGMRHTTDEEDESVAGARAAPALARVTQEPLRFVPGRRTLYTSWGYAALGCVIEEVSGQSYAEFVTDRVLSPVGMTRTTFDRPDYTAPDFSPGFRMKGRAFAPSLVVDTRFKRPASGIISTANDLTRFAMALFERRLLPEPLWREMLAAHPADDDERPVFTAGWMTAPTTLGTPVFSYNGSMEGTTAVLALLPERQIAVALLANRERFVPGVTPLVREALRAALGLPAE